LPLAVCQYRSLFWQISIFFISLRMILNMNFSDFSEFSGFPEVTAFPVFPDFHAFCWIDLSGRFG